MIIKNLIIPTLPPSVNNYWGWRVLKFGRKLIPKPYLKKSAGKFRRLVEHGCTNYALEHGGTIPLLYNKEKKWFPRLGIIIVFHGFKISKKVKKAEKNSLVLVDSDKWGWDVDNRVKPLLDALEHDRGRKDNTDGRFGLYWDDEQIDFVLVTRHPEEHPKPGMTQITIGESEMIKEGLLNGFEA